MQIQYGVSKYHCHMLVFIIAPSGMGKTQLKDFVSTAALHANELLTAISRDAIRLSGTYLGYENAEIRFLANPQSYVCIAIGVADFVA
jgi:hypothetical protein